MNIEKRIAEKAKDAIKVLYSADVDNIALESTNEDFKGDFTLVVFPYLKLSLIHI